MSHRFSPSIHLFFVALCLLASSFSAQAAPGAAKVSFQLLRAGVPEVGAPCTIRQFDAKTGLAKPPRRLRTDAKGRIDTEIILPPPRVFFGVITGPRYRDYMLIDAKDAPLVLIDLAMYRSPNDKTLTTKRSSKWN